MGTFILIIFLLAVAMPVFILTVGTIGEIGLFFYALLTSLGKESKAILTAPTFKEKAGHALDSGFQLLLLLMFVGIPVLFIVNL